MTLSQPFKIATQGMVAIFFVGVVFVLLGNQQRL